jgi:N-acetylmuramoyl-L-alanine amidase
MDKNKDLKNAVSAAEASLDKTKTDNLAQQSVNQLQNSLETVTGNIAGQVEGGIQSLTQEADKFQDQVNKLSTKEGLLDAGAQSFENLKTDLINGAAAALTSKFGANVTVEFSEPDSNGLVFPISSSLEEQGGIDGTIAAVLKLITGLTGIDAGSLQKAVVDGSPAGLLSAGVDLDLEGKIGALTSDAINQTVNDTIKSVTDELEASFSSTDLNRTINFVSGIDSDGAGNLVVNYDSATSTGPTVDSEFTAAINNIKNSTAEDIAKTITKDKEIKKNIKDNSDIENLSGGKDPKEVTKAVNSAPLTRVKYSKAVDQTNSIIQTRVAKSGEVGIVQSLSKEVLTDVNKRVKDFAPKLSDKQIERVINLSQGDAADQSDAVKLLFDKTGKPYSEIKTFIKTIDTTISSVTKPIPSEFVFEEPYVIGSYQKQWKNGEGDPVFPYISSTEEMQAEFKNITREVTEVVVHWTETPTNKNIGSEELNKIHLESGLKGIGYHYVIRRDGSLQRGRPVNIQGEHALVNNHDERSIGVVLVGGINVPSGTPNLENFISVQSLTRSQFNTFDHFCRGFYSRFPGGQIVGHNDIDPIENDPGFNVREYVLANFSKASKFTDPLKQSPFTVDEINNDE